MYANQNLDMVETQAYSGSKHKVTRHITDHTGCGNSLIGNDSSRSVLWFDESGTIKESCLVDDEPPFEINAPCFIVTLFSPEHRRSAAA